MSNEPAGRRVVVFGLGGTIAMSTAAVGRGVVPALSTADLVAAVPGLADLDVHLETVDFRRLPGASLDFDDLDALREAIGQQLADGTDGVVVTQGTDTIEEAAYALDLTHHGRQPIVVTGAMRNPTLAGADGPANLLAAVITAADPAACGLGCLVVFADEIHAAARVRKTHATSPGTFVSPNTGPLGHIVETTARILAHPTARFTVPAPAGDTRPRVGLYTVTLGDDDAMLEAAAGNLNGLVVAGFGAGHVPDRLVPLLERLTARMPIVLASRTGAGSSLRHTYAFPGSEQDLLDRGLLGAGFLDPYKARILLRTLLRAGADRTALAAAFAAAGGHADPVDWPWPAASTANHRSPAVEKIR